MSPKMTNAEKTFKIRLEIPSDADDDDYESGIQEHCGIPWLLEMNLQSNKTNIELTCHEDDDENRIYEWGICAKAQAFLLLGDEEVPVGPKKTVEFDVDQYATFHVMRDVESRLRDYLEENDAVVEVRVTIKSMFGTRQETLEDFSEEEEGWTDLILKTGEKTFHVNKATLSRASPVIRAMLVAASKGPTPCPELIMDDTDPRIFEFFLQLCHGRTPNFKVDDVRDILELAEQYDVPNVKVLCQKHLISINEETLDNDEAIKVADEFEFYDFLVARLRFFETVEQFEILEPIVDSLSSKTLTIVLQMLAAVKKENRKSQFNVRKVNGKCTYYSIYIRPDETVGDVTDRIAKIEGNPAERQRIKVHGKYLSPRKRIFECIASEEYWHEFCTVLTEPLSIQ